MVPDEPARGRRRASQSYVLENLRGRHADPDRPSGLPWKRGAYFIQRERDGLWAPQGIKVETIYKGICRERAYYARWGPAFHIDGL